MSSCCGTKQVAEKPPREIAQLEPVAVADIPEDDIIKVTEAPETETQTELPPPPEPPEIIEVDEGIDDYAPEAFNHNAWNDLLQRHVSDAGNVNYKGFKDDQYVLRHYISKLGENMPTDSWNTQDKLAYWMNAYNAMTIDLIVRNYPINSIKDIKDPWKQRLWKLEEKWYNLDEIEHQILRKMNEPRIHFGIVCASFSCPKLLNKAFTAFQLEDQLTQATEGFLADTNRNEISQNRIKLSKVFQWFAKDFKQNGSLIDFLNRYSDMEISSKAKKSYKDYNWDLND